VNYHFEMLPTRVFRSNVLDLDWPPISRKKLKTSQIPPRRNGSLSTYPLLLLQLWK